MNDKIIEQLATKAYKPIDQSILGHLVMTAQREAFIKGYQQAQQEPKWVSVSERLPEERQDVLVSFDRGNGKPIIAFDYFTEGFFYRHHGVTHWQPLPSPPTTSEIPNGSQK